ncbi:PH domain-containing protein [Owenweeksia hongkongensis]|uniref:PH domain-containing protein n=1 Tax=Owenweeksia hongkongensis TaxID=253245 RepID=UPI003A8F1775
MPDSHLKKFEAKRGYLIAAFGLHAAVLSSLPLFLMDYENAIALKWMFGIILGFILLFTLGVYTRTYYVIDKTQEQLVIYFIFKVKTLKLTDIKGIEEVGSPLSGAKYALSADNGLIIKEGKYDSFFINPKDKKGFLKALNWKETVV